MFSVYRVPLSCQKNKNKKNTKQKTNKPRSVNQPTLITWNACMGALHSVTVSKLGEHTIVSKFDSHWVTRTSCLVPNFVTYDLNKWIKL